jgi:dienelactone hydrolase
MIKRLLAITALATIAVSTLRAQTRDNTHAFGQKPPVDSTVYGKWDEPYPPSLSDNGAYLWYPHQKQVILKAVNGNWETTVKASGKVLFVNGSRLALFQTGRDSLCIQSLGNSRARIIAHVKSFQAAQNGKAEWLLYQTDSPGKNLVITNLATGKRQIIDSVSSYRFDPSEKAVIIEKPYKNDQTALSWFDLKTRRLSLIWQGTSPGNEIFSTDGSAMAFTGSEGQNHTGVWYFHTGDEKVRLLLNTSPSGFPKGFTFNNLLSFNSLGDRIFLKLKENTTTAKPNPALASVDVYSYKDAKVQSDQLGSINVNTFYTYVFNLATNKLVLLAGKNEALHLTFDLQKSRNYVLVTKGNGGTEQEDNWNPAALSSLYLVSTADGSRNCLASDKQSALLRTFYISPDEQYIVHCDPATEKVLSYTMATCKTQTIAKPPVDGWRRFGDYYGPDDVDSIQHIHEYHWLENDDAVLIETRTDIYQADPSGKKPMLCLTGYSGHKNHLQFSVAKINTGNAIHAQVNDQIIDASKPLLLSVFNLDNKDEGFCYVQPGKENTPRLGKMMSCFGMERFLSKARDAEVYTAQLQGADRFPNWYLTKDFKSYQPLSDIQPQRNYNWLTSELVTWKLPDGKMDQGILYKPENFDPKKQYPVIFYYYEEFSSTVNKFLKPEYSPGVIDVPTYVSNGYLVFKPDIDYKVGHPGQSACDAIVSAAEYLDQFPWVDKDHMGLMGHSWGGFETNYLITHSHLFAAAASMSGLSDYVSLYNSIRAPGYNGLGVNAQYMFETGQNDIGATLWQRPDFYLENSPVLLADQVSTPVLLMANHRDEAVAYQQGLEFFLALRRLSKKAWLLQYDNGIHTVQEPIDMKDVTMRMQQFFDYYLKGKTAPVWMTEGIPAIKKQIDSGLELDYSGKQP